MQRSMARRAYAATLALWLAGCFVSVQSVDEGYDPQLAHETLLSALDAWKDGNVKALVTLESPIRFLDDDLLAGFQLEDYEIELTSGSPRPFQNIPVTLTLRKANQSIQRAATYQISLEPDRAVLRSDP